MEMMMETGRHRNPLRLSSTATAGGRGGNVRQEPSGCTAAPAPAPVAQHRADETIACHTPATHRSRVTRDSV